MLVATIRALKMHGGVKKDDLKKEDLKALEAGMANLQRHVENVKKFGLPAVVSINRFSADSDAEIALVKEKCKALGVEAIMADHWAMGGEGAADVAKAVVKVIDQGQSKLKFLYPDEMPLFEKVETIAREIYRAKNVTADKSVKDQLKTWEEMGYGKLPICVAKTQYSFSTNPDAKGAPADHTINVREVRLSAGAEFVVAICGEIMTMPGLPQRAGGGFDRRRRRRQDRRAVLDGSTMATAGGRRRPPAFVCAIRKVRVTVFCGRSRLRWNERNDAIRRFKCREKPMIKFYYSGAPNPMKVALMLEETGLPYEAMPVDTRKGEQHTPEYLAINPNAKVPAIVDGDATVFDSNAILLYLAEKTGKFMPAKHRQARGELLSWLMFVASGVGPYLRPVGALPPIRAGEDRIRHQPLHVRSAAPLRAFSKRASPSRNTCSATPTRIVDMALWGWARLIPNALGEEYWAKFPNLKRLVDEISARPAAAARQCDCATSTSSRPSSTRKPRRPCSAT